MNIPETYNQLDQWTTVMFLYNSALKAINTKIEILNNEFIHLYNYNPIEHTLLFRMRNELRRFLEKEGIML